MDTFAEIICGILRGILEPISQEWFERASARSVGWLFGFFVFLTGIATFFVPLDFVAVCGGIFCGSTGLLWGVARWRERVAGQTVLKKSFVQILSRHRQRSE